MKPILLLGNPNSGKTTLFNSLAKTDARTGNFPGVTVEKRSAILRQGARERELIDLPGTYSLSPRSPDEQIAADLFLAEKNALVVLVADATALQRSLYLAVEAAATGREMIVVLTMVDQAKKRGLSIDTNALSAQMGVSVVAVDARGGEEVEALRSLLFSTHVRSDLQVDYGAHQATLKAMVKEARDSSSVEDAARAILRASDPLTHDRSTLARLAGEALERDPELPLALIAARYEKVEQWARACALEIKTERARPDEQTRQIDRVLLHPLWGLVVFALVMGLLFEGLFSGADPAIGWIESGVEWLQSLVIDLAPEGSFRDLLVEGIIAGVGNVVVFVPQIAMLFLALTFLEDCGYLARVAFLIDRLMRGVGLHGGAFVPMLSGFACAIPAVMATRSIRNPKDRLVTMMVVPLMSCSARLPVYVLITAVIFSDMPRIGGVFSVGAVVLFSMYALSVVGALGAAAVLRRTVAKGPTPEFVLELPSYRLPALRTILRTTWTKVRGFLVDAGTVILAFTIILWALLNYPKDEALEAQYAAQLAQDDLSETQIATIEHEAHGARLAHSAAGRLGKAIEPALEPLGLDWRVGVGVLGAFAAREVFVSTLGIVFGVGEVEDDDPGLRSRLQGATNSEGAPLFTALSGIALMVFFVFAAQCMSTLAVVKRETGGWKWPVFMFGYMSAMAYVAALLVYQVGSLLTS